MYVWKVKFEEKWNNYDFFSDEEEYTVAADSYEQAIEKAMGVAIRSFVDDEGVSPGVTDVRLISIKRGDELDA